MKKILLLLITATLLSPAFAQEEQDNKKSKKEQRKLRIEEIAKQEEEGVIKYKKHTAFGGKLITDGYGAFIEVSRAQSVKRALLFQLEFSERKHKKEEKLSNAADFYGTTNPLIYGKQNFFYPIKLGAQQQFLLGNKGNRSGVGITANVGGGFVAGILRPYMPEVIKDGQRQYVYYFDKENSLSTDTLVTLIGGPGFGTGWDKLKFTPGFYAKLGVRFDFGKYNEMMNAIEIGISEEYYIKEIPQMAYSTQKQFFFSAYVAIMFGKRN